MTIEPESGASAVELAVELTIAWLGNVHTKASAEDVPTFLAVMRDSVSQLIGGLASAASNDMPLEPFIPAVSVRKSLASKDHIISLIDGKPYKMLRSHLRGHGLTPEEYRSRYNLKADYPMVAETYSAVRRATAKKSGFGCKPGTIVGPTNTSAVKRRTLKLPPVTG